MTRAASNPVVHLELLTANLSRACAFYTRLFGWRAERIPVLLDPREGPVGWRSIVSAPANAEIALWEPKPGS
jgi:predicted enzyme related to lactoylglutathione lyase